MNLYRPFLNLLVTLLLSDSMRRLFFLTPKASSSLYSTFRASGHNAPSPINIGLSIGGARGIGYPGAYKALVDAELMAGIKTISGSSVGALAAAVMAVGISPEELSNQIIQANIFALVNTVEHSGPNIIPGLTASLDPVKVFFNQLLVNSTYDFLLKQTELPNTVVTVLESLAHNQFTFNDLYILSQVFPERFKNLIIPATDFATSTLTLFEHQHFPDVPIALACTASSALPVKFAMVKIQNRYYQDAGLKLQIPSDLFTNEASADNTLLFLFNHTIWHGLINQDNDTYWNNAQSDLKRVDDLYMPMINSIFVLVNMYVLFIKSLFYPVMMLYFYLAQDSSKIKDYSNELFELVRHVYRMPISFSQVTSSLTTFSLVNGPYKKQIVLLDAATILTTSFFKAHEKSKMLQCLFYLDTMEFLIERKLYGGQAVACLDHFYDEIMTSYYQHLFHDMSHDSSKLDSKLEYKALRELINKDINRCEAKALENSVLDLMGKHTLFNDLNFNHRVGSNKSYSTNKNLLFTQQTLLSNTNSINSPPSTDDTDHCGHIHHR